MNYRLPCDPHNEIRVIIGAGAIVTPTLTRRIQRRYRPAQDAVYAMNRATTGPLPETIEAIYRRIR